MRIRLPWIALAVGAYLAFVLSTFPAAAAIRWFVPDQVRIAGASGTVWSGSAELASVPGLALRDVRWRIRGLYLVLGRISGNLSARLPNGFVEAQVTASPVSLSLRDVRLTTNLDSLAGLLPVSGASGAISATFESLVLRDGWPSEVRGEVRVADLLVEPYINPEEGLIALGTHEIRFEEAPEGEIRGVIRDLGGPLEISGSLSFTQSRDYVLDGQLLARPDAAPGLLQGIDLMTSDPDSSGHRRFTFTGSL